MKPKHIKKVLMSEINKVANNPKDYCFHPDTDFTRKRKISMKAVLTGIIGMGSGSLTNELIDFFHASPQMPTPSAFLQQRSKIKEQYPLEKLKQLYALRWGIETSFRDLKYTIGMLDFHSKKVMCIQQEIYAHLIMYNFAEMITSHVVIEKKQRKYTYKANFSVASHLCRLFYREKTTSPDLETIIAKNVIPIRPDRHGERKATTKIFHGFLYRVA